MTAGFHYELGINPGNTGDLVTSGGVRKSTRIRLAAVSETRN
jgi:hypothetical protein